MFALVFLTFIEANNMLHYIFSFSTDIKFWLHWKNWNFEAEFLYWHVLLNTY